MDKELVQAFVRECIDVQEWKARVQANQIEMDEWFKYSGEVEEDDENYKQLMTETRSFRANGISKQWKTRKEYFKMYWLKKKFAGYPINPYQKELITKNK
jgi:hypothetical protein